MTVALVDKHGHSNLLSFKKTCARLSIPETTGRIWILSNRFPPAAAKIDSRFYWSPADIDAFLANYEFVGTGNGRRLRPKQAASA